MSDGPRQLPAKKEVALHLLEEGPSLFIHLDPRRSGVVVPKWFTGQPQLVLQVGLNMPIPIPDLKVEDTGISCTLSFNRSPFWCRLPWSAIYALVGEDGLGMVWPDDVPPEVALQMQKQTPAGPARPAPAKRPRAKLAAVDADGESSPPRQASRGRASRDEPKPEREPARLEAVPPRPARPVPVPSPAPRAEDEGGDEAAPQRPSQGGGKKPKRELPPYLRVIK
jgi:stringent starvation protein B